MQVVCMHVCMYVFDCMTSRQLRTNRADSDSDSASQKPFRPDSGVVAAQNGDLWSARNQEKPIEVEVMHA